MDLPPPTLLVQARAATVSIAALRAFVADTPAMSVHLDVLLSMAVGGGWNVNSAHSDGSSPLVAACTNGSLADVEMLLELGASPTKEAKGHNRLHGDDWKVTPLTTAALHGRIHIFRALLKRGEVDINHATSDTGCTALFCAAQDGHVKIVCELLRFGKASSSSSSSIVESIPIPTVIPRLVDVNAARIDTGETPLCIACTNGHFAVVRALLAHPGVDVNRRTHPQGATPLYVAANQGQDEIVRVLLQATGVHVNQARQDDGTSPCFRCSNYCTRIHRWIPHHATGLTPAFVWSDTYSK
jgi:ankyrin repeat protein